MRSLFSCLLALSACLPAAALAGDPCPIEFTFYDLGTPPWLEQSKLLDALTTKDSWLGMSFKTNAAVPGKAPAGVQVTNVSAGSPSAKAALKAGDVITAANGEPLLTFQAFNTLLDATSPGSVLALQVTRDGKSEAKTLTLSRQDPVLGALIREASKQECGAVTRGDASPSWIAKVQPHMYAKNKRFRCDDAGEAIAKALGDDALGAGDTLLLRGSKRMLFVAPGLKTFCVSAKDYDGAKLTPAAVKGLFSKLTKAYIADRHANP
ncbi:MAG: hypothetical protein ACI9U2_003815 [Bradymonadia bacterium]|jgi:hypothetical protein